jgi:hypothetical protein
MMIFKRPAVKWVIIIVCMLWVALYYSNSGILISGHEVKFVAPDTKKEFKYQTCRYFTGMSFVVKDFWSAKQGEKQSCPVLVKLD